MSERAKTIDEAKLRVLGIDALNKALGPAEALRFLALFHRETTDYVEVSKNFTKIRVWKISSKGPKNTGGAEVKNPTFS
jgi:hypothetical protein